MGSSWNGVDKVKYRGSSTLFPKKLHFLKSRITKCLKNMFSSIEVKFCWMISNSSIGKHLLSPKWADYTEKVSLSQGLANYSLWIKYSPSPVCVLLAIFKEYLHVYVVRKQSKEHFWIHQIVWNSSFSVHKKKFIYLWTLTFLLDYNHPHSLMDYLGLFLHSNNKVE